MADREGNIIEIRANSNSVTIFDVNKNSFYSPRGVGNPSPISVVPGNYKDNVARFNEGINDVYGGNSDYDQTRPFFSFGFRQPYVWTSPSDSNAKKFLKKFDNRAFPIGSTIQDVERLSKMTVSGHGIFWLLQQQALHLQAPFDETNIVDPTSHLVSAARPAGLGLIPRVTKHLSGGSLIGSLFDSAGKPKSTVGQEGLPDATKDVGLYGLLRGNTATSGKNKLDIAWNNQNTQRSGGFLKSILRRIAPSVGASQPGSAEFRADEDAYSIMIEDVSKPTGKLRKGSSIRTTDKISGFHFYSNESQYIESPNTVFPTSYDEDTSSDENRDRKSLRNKWKDSFINEEDVDLLYKNINTTEERGGRFSDLQQKLQDIQEMKSEGNRLSGNARYYTNNENEVEKSSPSKRNLYDYSRESTKPKKGLGMGITTYNGKSSNTHDQLNAQRVLDSEDGIQKDIIKFLFNDIVNNKYIPFRATLKSISDNANADWSDIKYAGRADRVYVYNGVTRDLSFNFRVYATSKKEMAPMWSRINYLIGLTYPSRAKPTYIENRTTNIDSIQGESDATIRRSLWQGIENGRSTAEMRDNGHIETITYDEVTFSRDTFSINIPPFIRLTIGDLYVKHPCIIKSVGTTIPDEFPWDIEDNEQLPMMVDISISATLLERYPPHNNNQNHILKSKIGDLGDMPSNYTITSEEDISRLQEHNKKLELQKAESERWSESNDPYLSDNARQIHKQNADEIQSQIEHNNSIINKLR